MTRLHPVLLVASMALLPFSFACNCDGAPGATDDGGAGIDGGGDGGAPDGGSTDAGRHDGGPSDGGDGGSGRPAPNPNNPNNSNLDTDCDGLSDAEEFADTYAGGLKTDPANPDSDGDGIPDGVEAGKTDSVDPLCAGYTGDADTATRTDPTDPDSDGDGLPDGVEDANHNGRVDPGESDPLDPDTDGDGIPDGVEDANGNGQVDPGETDPTNRDTDGDGIPDGIEDTSRDGVLQPGETDPTNPDTDGDGIPDGVEDKNHNGRVDPGETDPRVPDVDTDMDGITDAVETNVVGTDPMKADTDGDGLLDGIEDKNQNGQLNLGETDPLRVDTDCDGLTDGQEDANGNGQVDAGETDPNNPDTDGDGLTDGLESGVSTNPDPAHCPGFVVDADPSTTTDPLNPDTDGDGILDGAEDRNANGRVDAASGQNAAELDPNNGNDATPVVVEACATQNLVQVLLRTATRGDLNFATLSAYGDVTTLTAGGDEVGVMVFDPAQKVLGVALSRPPTGGDVNADATYARNAFGSTGGEANAITQPFTSWDGYPAVRGTLDWNSSSDIKDAANAWASAVRGGIAGLWTNQGGASGPFEVSFEVLRRSNNRSVFVAAFAPAAGIDEARLIAMDDLANGSPVAQLADVTGVQCDTFLTENAQPVDFLYVIDNSCSMGDEQQALSDATAATVNQLQNSTLDWRIGVIYTDFYNTNSFAGFTTDLATFQSRTTPGTGGSGDERPLESAQRFIQNRGNEIRSGAQLVVVILTDEDERSNGVNTSQENNFVNFFQSNNVSVNGLICRPGFNTSNCYNVSNTHERVITRLGGVLGHIEDLSNIGPTISTIISAVGGATSPYVLTRAPISATLKVAMDDGMGGLVTVPRSRSDGFDFDGASGSIQLFGSYRPAQAGLPLAVSYRYWDKRATNPDGTVPCGGPCPDPLVCNTSTDQCECPPDCGAPQPGPAWTCDVVSCTWQCPADCGGTCSGYEVCDTTSCGCVCDQNISCRPGYQFDPVACGCSCDPIQLDCGGNYVPDLDTCACVCPPDCGGNCQVGETCNMSSCACIFTEVP